MFADFLKPVSKELQDFAKSCNSFCLGSFVRFTEEPNLGSILAEEDKIAIIGLQEFRSKNNDEQDDTHFDYVRTAFYELNKGNWYLPIYDFGDLISTTKKEEFGELFTKVLTELIKQKYFVIILGGSPSLAYYQYRAYDDLIKNINYFSVDEKLRLGNEIQYVNDENYLTKIIVNEPLNLQDFVNLGYQTYFVAQEELDLINELNFEAIRLGLLTDDIKEAEHFIREANAGILNLGSIESNSYKSSKDLTPNGFNSREICALAKYIGSNNVLSSVYLSNYIEKYLKVDHLLVSQIIWYLIEGRNFRPERLNFKEGQYFEKIYVPSDINNFVFYRNYQTNQWWLEVKYNELEKVIPCSEKDYLQAQKGDVPSRWWKFFKKSY